MPWNVPVFDSTGKIKDASLGDAILADSASQADVSTAVGLASDGDTVLIPNGTVTWTSGISTTKQIIIRAQNYTPTPAGTEGAGATTRNVTITNNTARGTSQALFQFVTGSSYHVGIGGIRFDEGTGDSGMVGFTGSGSKIPFVFDCYMENSSRQWPAIQIMTFACRGGLIWNYMQQGTQTVSLVGEGSCLIKWPNGIRDWESASTMGDADDGTWNVYMEDSTVTDVGNFPDIDDHGRYVARHCIYDGSWGETHGFTSTWGGRHWEFYDNTFQGTTENRNLANRYFWCRAGTGVFTDNEVLNVVTPSEYGSTDQLMIGDNTSPGTYLQDRQPGCGHNGSAYISDPIYIWNQTGARAYNWSYQGSPGGWDNIVVDDRDIFVDNGAKSGYTKYTYPHPLRAQV